jgi:hypothetical protein
VVYDNLQRVLSKVLENILNFVQFLDFEVSAVAVEPDGNQTDPFCPF